MTAAGNSWSGEVGRDIEPSLRLDRYVAEYLKLFSRSQIRARELSARINGRPVKISRILKGGDFLELSWIAPPPLELIPENLPLDILYEDSRVVVVNKAQGMVVHPGAGNRTGTLANALLWRRLERGGAGEGLRPGIVHRLDKETSGVMIAAWDDEAHDFLAGQFRNRAVQKTYLALACGAPPAPEGSIDTFLARDSRNRKCFTASPCRGKRALTFYRVIRSWKDYSLLLLRPKTGRTHQIRVHLRYLGCPIAGDPLYGTPSRSFSPALAGASLMLHSLRLRILLPERGLHSFTAPVPGRFREIFRILRLNEVGDPLHG